MVYRNQNQYAGQVGVVASFPDGQIKAAGVGFPTRTQPRSRPVAAQPGSYESSTDTVLITACLQGDNFAWDQLVKRYSPLVYSLPLRMGLSTADADDVLQNVFTIVFRHLAGLKNHITLAAWLITITRRECIRYSRGWPEHSALDDEILDGGTRLGDQVEQRELKLLVHEALGRLDPTSRTLLSAMFLEYPTPSYVSIARRLGMAVGSIGPARARCLKKLEAVLCAMEPEAFGPQSV